MIAFSPNKRTATSTPFQMKYLAKRFSKLVENIEPQEGLDIINGEIDGFTTDDEIKEIAETNYEDFWTKVSKIDGGEWSRYPILSRFALVLATAFNSNSEAERGFSIQSDIHRNPKRNCMDQDTFEAQMQVHYGVEDKQSKALCTKSIEHKAAGTTPSHCQC